MTAKTLQELISEQTPAPEPFRGGPLIRLGFEGLYRLYETAPQEAHDLYDRIVRLLADNTTEEERQLGRKYGFLPRLDRPTSTQRPHPPTVWEVQAVKLAEKRALELHPGSELVESWVFNLHSDLGVSVVIAKAKP